MENLPTRIAYVFIVNDFYYARCNRVCRNINSLLALDPRNSIQFIRVASPESSAVSSFSCRFLCSALPNFRHAENTFLGEFKENVSRPTTPSALPTFSCSSFRRAVQLNRSGPYSTKLSSISRFASIKVDKAPFHEL